jgi:hypothetical protein
VNFCGCGKKCDQERKRESHERKGEKQRKYCTETVDVTNSGRTSPTPNNLLHMAKSESKTCQEFLLQCRAVECIVACISLSLSLVRSQIQSPITCCLILTGYRTFQKKKKSRETYPDKPCVTLELGFLHFYFGIARPIILKDFNPKLNYLDLCHKYRGTCYWGSLLLFLPPPPLPLFWGWACELGSLT